MSLLRATTRRLAALPSTAPAVFSSVCHRATFATTTTRPKSVAEEMVKDTLLTGDNRAVSEKLADVTDLGATAVNKIKEAGADIVQGAAKGAAAKTSKMHEELERQARNMVEKTKKL